MNEATKKPATTFKTLPEPKRGPVTRDTVRQLVKNDSLRQVAEIARKYAK
jgi:hypothetical protein